MAAVLRNRFKKIALLLAGLTLVGGGLCASSRVSASFGPEFSRTIPVEREETAQKTPEIENSPVSPAIVEANRRKFREAETLRDSVSGKNPVRAMAQLGHEGSIEFLCWSPDGTRLATGGGDPTVFIWDTATGKLLARLVGHLKAVLTARWSPDGKILATGSLDTTVCLWNPETGVRTGIFQGHSRPVGHLEWSPDGGRILSISSREAALVWNPDTQDILHRRNLASEGISFGYWSPDGTRALLGPVENDVLVWPLAENRPESRFSGHTDAVVKARWSPDGKRILTISKDRTVRLWEAAEGKELRRFSLRSNVMFPDWSPDGDMIAAADEFGTVSLYFLEMETGATKKIDLNIPASTFKWSPVGNRLALTTERGAVVYDARTGREIELASENGWAGAGPVWSPDGKRFAVGYFSGNRIAIFDAAGNRPLNIENQGNSVRKTVWSPDSTRFLTVQRNDGVTIWSPEKTDGPVHLRGPERGFFDAVWSPDSARVATAGWDEVIRVWNATTGKEIWTFSGHSKSVNSVRWSPDGRRLLSKGQEAAAYITTPESDAAPVRLYANKSHLINAEWSPDGSRVLTSAADGVIRVWDAASGKELLHRAAKDPISARAFWSPDGKSVLQVWVDDAVRVFNAATLEETVHFGDEKSPATVAIWSPDGKSILTGAQFPFDRDKTAHIWDAATGTETMRLVGHSLFVESAEWSADSKRVLTFSEDRTAAIWDVRTGEAISVFAGHSGHITSVSFSKDGGRILTSGDDGTVRLWDAATGRELCQLVSFRNGADWAVVDPEGRFDVSDPTEVSGLHWVVMENGRAKPYGIELFFRQYYEPGLLRRIVGGETFKPIPSIASLDRSQPVVIIGERDVVPVLENGNQTGMADVTVTVTPPAGSSDSKSAKAFDLKLFRDGQLVGFSPGELSFSGGEGFRKTFRVRLPRRSDPKTVEFSAYCFNGDSVRSTRAVRTVPLPELKTVKGKAYVVTFGVNRYQNPRIHPLRFAVADALALQKSLGDRVAGSEAFSEVVRVSLTSETGRPPTATRENLKAVFMKLAGRPVPETGIPGFEKLAAATPEDLIVLMFAGHGSCGEGGEFFVVPFDTGAAGDPLKKSISSAELTEWMRDVDAGEMAMILDTCQSGGAVGENFKPGPMDSRGLGQLSYDKGMRILAATQADNVALESGVLKQGFLSFSLAIEGLDEGKADFAPLDGVITLDEWLAYGARRVPELPAAIAAGTIRARILTQDATAPSKKPQVPVVFDFARRRARVVLQKTEKK
jgi:WD40 repeat protein